MGADAVQPFHILYVVAHDLRHDLAATSLELLARDRGCVFSSAFANKLSKVDSSAFAKNLPPPRRRPSVEGWAAAD